MLKFNLNKDSLGPYVEFIICLHKIEHSSSVVIFQE
jgi:hypothetical protein